MQRFTSTFSISFYCKESKTNKKGLAPVVISINLQGTRIVAGTGRQANPKKYLKDPELLTYMRVVEERIRCYETDLLLEGKTLTPEALKEFIRNGYSRPDRTVGWMITTFLGELKTRVENHTLTPGVYRKYEYLFETFVDYTKVDLGQTPEAITPRLVNSFVDYIYANYAGSSASCMLIKLKSIFIWARENGIIQTIPFTGKIRREVKDVVPLTENEVNTIRQKDLSYSPRLERVRDLFLFAVGTGVAYVDCNGLEPDDFQIAENGRTFISKDRAKTGVDYTVVVLPEALEIAKKYNYSLPKISNQKVNSYLKEIQDVCGIRKELHFHLARHTYACLLLNKYHMPLEIAAKCMGHSSTRQTAHYAKIWNNTVFEAFDNIIQ